MAASQSTARLAQGSDPASARLRPMRRRQPVRKTDLSALGVPAGLELGERRERVAEQAILVHERWWNDAIASRGLPGGPLRVERRHGDTVVLTREGVWSHAARAAEDDEAALRLLWHTLAWGAGMKLRLCNRRMDAIASHPHAAKLLREAAALSRQDPVEAYRILHPRGIGVLSGLGPAFGTKYLYFAGGGDPAHPSLIFDSQVATTLAVVGWTSLTGRAAWAPATYGRYVGLLARWARELSDGRTGGLGRRVAADELERWLFRPPAPTAL